MKADAASLLRSVGVQPTRIRIALADYLFDGEHKHVTAQEALDALRAKRHLPSLASLYNTLNEFCRVGLVRRLMLDNGPAWFDTRVEPHFHVFHEDEGRLEDVATEELKITGRPQLPKGVSVRSVDVIFRVARK